MNTFTNLKQEKNTSNTLFTNDNISIVENTNSVFINEKDKLYILPYLVNKKSIIMKYAENLAYTEKFKFIDKFPLMLSTYIDDAENFQSIILTYLTSECGLKIDDDTKIDISKPLFYSDNNTSQFYYTILPLYDSQYDIISNDSETTNVLINTNDIKTIINYDLISMHILTDFMLNYKL